MPVYQAMRKDAVIISVYLCYALQNSRKDPSEMTIWKDASCGLQCDIHDFKALIALLTWKHLGGKPRWMTLHDEIG